jgi:hypothetical protein
LCSAFPNCRRSAREPLLILLDPFAQPDGVDTVLKRDPGYRHAWLQAGLDQLEFGLPIIPPLAVRGLR